MLLQNYINRSKFIEYVWNKLDKVDQTGHNRYLLNLCYEFFDNKEIVIISCTEFTINGVSHIVECGKAEEEISNYFWYEYRH